MSLRGTGHRIGIVVKADSAEIEEAEAEDQSPNNPNASLPNISNWKRRW